MIDGVDVSTCFFYGETLHPTKSCTIDSEYLHSCKGSNCYFKQLARKEQECEAKILEFEGIKKQLNQLKAENEQAEQKLKRIREFATALCYTVMSDGVVTLQKDILQIIDEVK